MADGVAGNILAAGRSVAWPCNLWTMWAKQKSIVHIVHAKREKPAKEKSAGNLWTMWTMFPPIFSRWKNYVALHKKRGHIYKQTFLKVEK
jgi:hypothetical protein